MLGELFWSIFGAGYMAKESVKKTCKSVDDNKRKKMFKDYIVQHTDVELEKKLRAEIRIPSNYDKIWERIEEHKQRGGALSTECGWKFVGTKRLRYFDEKGRTPKDTRLETNRMETLRLLMNTYGKRSVTEADVIASKLIGSKSSPYIEYDCPEFHYRLLVGEPDID
jgi:hypothetical protein